MADWKDLTKPTSGVSTKKALQDDIIDDLNLLRSGAGGGYVGDDFPNGSMENDTNGLPDLWEFTPSLNGDGVIDTNDAGDGASSFAITSPGGEGGGGELLYPATGSYFSVSIGCTNYLKWLMKCSTATMRNVVEALYYDMDGVYVSSETLLDYSAGNPTSWTLFARKLTIPATATQMSLKFTGGVTGHATGGVVHFDAVGFFSPTLLGYTYIGPTETTYVCKENVVLGDIMGWGGGGGGSVYNDVVGMDGTVGRLVLDLIGGTTYSASVGVGGAEGDAQLENGSPGGDSSFDSHVIGFGGYGAYATGSSGKARGGNGYGRGYTDGSPSAKGGDGAFIITEYGASC
jgi:hypothetical protein